MDKEQEIYKVNWDLDKQNTRTSSNLELMEVVFDGNASITLELAEKQACFEELLNWEWSICALKSQGEESKLVTAELKGGRLIRKANATIVDFIQAVLTVSLVNQKENGGEGFTFTTYIYPNGRDNDYALENAVSFSTISEALLYIDKIIKTIEK